MTVGEREGVVVDELDVEMTMMMMITTMTPMSEDAFIVKNGTIVINRVSVWSDLIIVDVIKVIHIFWAGLPIFVFTRALEESGPPQGEISKPREQARRNIWELIFCDRCDTAKQFLCLSEIWSEIPARGKSNFPIYTENPLFWREPS